MDIHCKTMTNKIIAVIVDKMLISCYSFWHILRYSVICFQFIELINNYFTDSYE